MIRVRIEYTCDDCGKVIATVSQSGHIDMCQVSDSIREYAQHDAKCDECTEAGHKETL